MRLARAAFLLLVLFALPGTSHRAAAAGWPHDPNTGNVGICTIAGDQYASRTIPDGSGGTIVAWIDYRGATLADIYVQRIDAAGTPLWTANGVPVCTAANFQLGLTLTSDGSGGAILAWQDARFGVGYDIFAQRVNASGVPQWTADGVAVGFMANDQLFAEACPDGAGGAFLVWQDFRSAVTQDVYAQHLNSSGVATWAANGVAVSTAANDQTVPVIVSDGATGAIIAWRDQRSGTADIYVQKLTASGSSVWLAGGIAICSAPNNQYNPKIVSNGAGGAIIAWEDFRGGATFDIYAQYVSSNGSTLWGSNGVAICSATGDQGSPSVAADGTGGACIAWQDFRSANSDVYVQRLNSAGTAQWTADGVALVTLAGEQSAPSCASDGAGGAIVAWQDVRGVGHYDIFAQRLTSAGATAWTANGVAISTAVNTQYAPVICAGSDGGAVVYWSDSRSSTSSDVYAQRVDHFGQLGDAAPAIVGIKDVLNDQGGFLKVNWSGSYLDADPTYGISEYRVFRSAPSALAANGVRRAVTDDSDVAAAEGALLVLPNAAAATYWEFVGSQTAEGLATYSKVVATTADSIPGSFPRTQFMIEARTSTLLSAPRWFSAPDSGYSVDNLAPAAPAPLTGQYSAGTTQLHWHRNTEADLAGYRLYRGSSVAFVPGPSNFVTALADTGAADAAGAPYVYKLTAIDSHGNESPVATLIPAGTLGVSDGTAPSLSFAAPSPNPARGATTLRFSLPKRGPARLSVYDAAGRRVQTLHDGALEAGAHTMAFALRDEAGHELPSGLYLLRFEAEGRVITRRLAAVR